MDTSKMLKEYERLNKRRKKIYNMFFSRYIDMAQGIFTEQRFMKLIVAIGQEQEPNHRGQGQTLMMRQLNGQKSEVHKQM